MSDSDDPHLGIFSTRRLRDLGHSTGVVRRMIADQRLIRIRPGWFHVPSAHPDAVDAVRIGGILTATSGSRHHGLWTFDDQKLHVLVSRSASRIDVGSPSLPTVRPVCVHWAKGTISRTTPVAEPLQFLVDSTHCQPRVTAVAMADSALNKHCVSQEDLRVRLPRLAHWCDPSCQSGTETKVRLGMLARGVKVRSQFAIIGVGRVDLLVGDRLVIECDSAEFHDGYHSIRDYERDQELIRRGYVVLRLEYRHVIDDWERIEAIILEIVRARRHMWRTGVRARGTVFSL